MAVMALKLLLTSPNTNYILMPRQIFTPVSNEIHNASNIIEHLARNGYIQTSPTSDLSANKTNENIQIS